MTNLNSILLEGNIVRDPELSYTPKKTPVCKFSVACNRQYKAGEKVTKEVSFFDVTAWSRLAEVCGEYLKKGRGVRIVGRLRQERWTDPDGKPHSRVLIVAEHVEFKPKMTAPGQFETGFETGTEIENLEDTPPMGEDA